MIMGQLCKSGKIAANQNLLRDSLEKLCRNFYDSFGVRRKKIFRYKCQQFKNSKSRMKVRMKNRISMKMDMVFDTTKK